MPDPSPAPSAASLFDLAPGSWEIIPSARISADDASIAAPDHGAAEGFLRQFLGDFMIMSRLREVLALTDPVFLLTDDSVIDILAWRLASRELVVKKLGPKDSDESGGSGGGGQAPADEDIIEEARQLYNSIQMNDLRAAHKSGRMAKVIIGKHTIQYEAQAFSGRPRPDGFAIGKQALASESELKKAVLQELYRRHHKKRGGKGDAKAEADAALQFAERSHINI